jgi:uncharacterized protein (TIGR03437 family)
MRLAMWLGVACWMMSSASGQTASRDVAAIAVSQTTLGGSRQDLPRATATDAQGNFYIAGTTNSPDFPISSGSLRQNLPAPLRALTSATPAGVEIPVGNTISVGPVGGTDDGRVLCVSTTDGIWVSGDAGATWRRAAPLPLPANVLQQGLIPVNSIAVDQVDPARVFVATSFGLFSSFDAGGSWFPRHTGLTVSANGYPQTNWIVFDPQDRLVLYTITVNPSNLFRSTDGGVSWTRLDPAHPGESAPPDLNYIPIAAALSTDGRSLYAVNRNGAFLRSLDRGATWTKLSQQMFPGAYKISVDPTRPSVIYIKDDANLWRSADSGATFTSIATGSTARNFAVDGTGAVFIADFQFIRFSPDGIAPFTLVSQQLFSLNALTAAGGKVYAGLTTPSVPFVMKVDPTGTRVLYSTLLGGSSGDVITALAVTRQGEVVVAGTTVSPDFPGLPPGTPAPAFGKGTAFIARLSADGSRLVYVTLLGGSKSTGPESVAVDPAGSVFVTGSTQSTDFPTTEGALQRGLPLRPCSRPQSNPFLAPNLQHHAFVVRLNNTGAITYSTYLSGSCGGSGEAITVDANGNATVVGSTTSPDFPVTPNAYQNTFPGQPDQASPPNPFQVGFASRLSASGDRLLASTFFGGGFSTLANAVALDAAGNPVITGSTQGFPGSTSPGAIQPDFKSNCVPTLTIGPSVPNTGTTDGFVLKLNGDFTAAPLLTYLGGGCNDAGQRLALDPAGNIWISGFSNSPDFPLFDPFNAGGIPIANGFLTELNPDATRLLFSSFSDSTNVAVSPNAVFQAGFAGTGLTITRLDPSITSPVHIDRIEPVNGYPSLLTTPGLNGLAPGQYIEIKGRNLGPASKVNGELDSVGRLPFVLGGVTVRFDSIPAALISVQAESILCFAPFGISTTTRVTVSNGGQRSNTVIVGVPATLPRILSIVNADGTANSAERPAKLGSTVAVYLSGLGVTTPQSTDGLTNTAPFPAPAVPVSVYLLGMQLATSYAGPAPGMIAGISQVNVSLPSTLNDVSNGRTTISVNGGTATLFVTQ